MIGVTPDIDPTHRGNEIDAWLDAYSEDCQYVIIDDTPFIDFFNKNQLEHLFQVDECTGIDEDTKRSIINHLCNI